MTNLDEDPHMKGSIESTKISPIQNSIMSYIGYFAKIAVVLSSTETEFKIERPNGLLNYLKEVETRERETRKKLSEAEKKKIENEIRYDKFRKPIGNAITILNHILGDAMSGNEWQIIIEKARKEGFEISKLAGTDASSYDKRDGL